MKRCEYTEQSKKALNPKQTKYQTSIQSKNSSFTSIKKQDQPSHPIEIISNHFDENQPLSCHSQSVGLMSFNQGPPNLEFTQIQSQGSFLGNGYNFSRNVLVQTGYSDNQHSNYFDLDSRNSSNNFFNNPHSMNKDLRSYQYVDSQQSDGYHISLKNTKFIKKIGKQSNFHSANNQTESKVNELIEQILDYQKLNQGKKLYSKNSDDSIAILNNREIKSYSCHCNVFQCKNVQCGCMQRGLKCTQNCQCCDCQNFDSSTSKLIKGKLPILIEQEYSNGSSIDSCDCNFMKLQIDTFDCYKIMDQSLNKLSEPKNDAQDLFQNKKPQEQIQCISSSQYFHKPFQNQIILRDELDGISKQHENIKAQSHICIHKKRNRSDAFNFICYLCWHSKDQICSIENCSSVCVKQKKEAWLNQKIQIDCYDSISKTQRHSNDDLDIQKQQSKSLSNEQQHTLFGPTLLELQKYQQKGHPRIEQQERINNRRCHCTLGGCSSKICGCKRQGKKCSQNCRCFHKECQNFNEKLLQSYELSQIEQEYQFEFIPPSFLSFSMSDSSK